ncbi:MAG: 2OG-Fe(II) oxygenase [Gloeotrichia echinulata CP02]
MQEQANLAYQEALKKHAANLPKISTNDMNIVEKLKYEGVAITSLDALGIDSSPAMFQAAKNLIPKLPNQINGDKNEFVIHADSQQMMKNLEIQLWGIEQRLLNIAENYIGLPVAYHGAYFRRDFANKIQQKTRLWHLDNDDRKVVKIILYLNDVNEDGGPFQYIPKSFASRVGQSLNYHHGYIADTTIQKIVSPSNWRKCTGPAGTVIFAAVANTFHRGMLPIAADRFSIFFDYTSRRVQQPFYGSFSLPPDTLFLLANTLTKQQRKCIFWQPHSLSEPKWEI